MRKFSEDEIREIIRTARVLSSELTAEQYQQMVGMQQEFAKSGFIEAGYGVLRLEQEYGIPCSQAPDRYVQIVNETNRLEAEAAELRKKRVAAQKRLAETLDAVSRAEAKQSQTKAELRRVERERLALRRQTEAEKKRLAKEVEDARKRARVAEQDIASAGELKAQVVSHGLDLELALRLFEEFAHDEDPARSLAEAVTEHGSQLKARKALGEENEALKAQAEETQEKGNQLRLEAQQQQEALSRLRADVKEQERLRRFHQRYQPASQVLDYLSTWQQVIPLRCQGVLCQARFWVNRGPSNFRANFTCPCCGLGPIDYDREACIKLGLDYIGPFKIDLGGDEHG